MKNLTFTIVLFLCSFIYSNAQITVDFTSDYSASGSCNIPLAVNFSDQSSSSSGSIIAWEWDFGNGNQSTDVNPYYLYEYISSSPIVLLTAYSTGLCEDTATQAIVAGNFEDYFNLSPPNVITPNGDGVNDVFKLDLPEQLGECTIIQVFNRWGQKVFSAISYNNITTRWDGRNDGNDDLPHGTYYYVIDLNDGTEPMTGHVTILR